MEDFVRVSVSAVEAFFNRKRVLRLPWFQRAYAWREDNVSRLLSDVIEAMDQPKPRYSLGHIHLAGPQGSASMALIDGHQRAITLTMLFAILRDVTASDANLPEAVRLRTQRRLHDLIGVAAEDAAKPAPGSTDLAAPTSWRLETQPQMAAFFERTVQLPGATLIEPQQNLGNLTPAERNLIANRDKIRTLVEPANMAAETRVRLIDFLLTGCHVIVLEVDDEEEAWSMLGTEQTTRLPHDTSELAKITLIDAMPAAVQEPAGRIWESAQAQIGNERMTELLGHLRTAKLQKRSTKPLEAELQQLYRLDRDGLGFMTNVLLPNVEVLRRIDARQIGTGTLAGIIGRHLEFLSWLDHRQWVAPALVWLTTKGGQHPETEHFFTRLDRFAWMLRLAGTDPNEQENRFRRLTHAARSNQAVDKWSEFAIEARTIEAALGILRSRTFYYKHLSNRVLRRLCHLLGSDPGPIDGVKVSIEHVLPRNPPKERKWIIDFPTETVVDDHTDRLGNLALLTGPQNRKADTNDWPIKREILKASQFALSGEAAVHAKWTPKTIDARTEKLIKRLLTQWDLPAG